MLMTLGGRLPSGQQWSGSACDGWIEQKLASFSIVERERRFDHIIVARGDGFSVLNDAEQVKRDRSREVYSSVGIVVICLPVQVSGTDAVKRRSEGGTSLYILPFAKPSSPSHILLTRSPLSWNSFLGVHVDGQPRATVVTRTNDAELDTTSFRNLIWYPATKFRMLARR
jgi:hypothetical protein